MGIRADLVIPQGKAWTGPLWALIGEDGGPMSLDGRTVRAQVRPTDRDADVLHEWSTSRGNVHATRVEVELDNGDGSTRTITTAAIALTVRPSESSAWRWTQGVFDVELTTDADPESTLGIIDPSAVRVQREVTR